MGKLADQIGRAGRDDDEIGLLGRVQVVGRAAGRAGALEPVCVGKDGPVPLPISGPRGVVRREVRLDLDEPLLQEIAERTGGQYFRATDANTLQEIFDTIDELETVEIESEIRTLYSERFSWVLWPGLLLLLLERGLWDTRLGRIP